LAGTDPDGNDSIGITRTATAVETFVDDDAVKFAGRGGHDAWPATRYLNIWVCNLKELLGYASFPGEEPRIDGVVISYKAFGTEGNATAPFNLGRTGVHEVGHWLNLFHIWGDDGAGCSGDDFVDDTPNQAGPNQGTPIYPHVSCGNAPDGDMFMNYLDYSHDGIMCMFTLGQSDRMDAALQGARSFFLQSLGPAARIYTISEAERAHLRFNAGYVEEAPACYVLPTRANGAGDHFYTTSPAERDNALAQLGYVSEGTACYTFDAPGTGRVPLHRLVSLLNGDHFYTTSPEERDNALAQLGYVSEGTACYTFDAPGTGRVPLYRLVNLNNGDHFYTTSPEERDALGQLGYVSEGTACYVMTASSPVGVPFFRLRNAEQEAVPLYRILDRNRNHTLYTTAPTEGQQTDSGRWIVQGIACFVFTHASPTTTPLFRLEHPASGSDLLTASTAERDDAIARDGYEQRGIACYAYDYQASRCVPFFRLRVAQ